MITLDVLARLSGVPVHVVDEAVAAERERIRLAVEALERCDSGCVMGQYVDVDEVLAAIGGDA